MPVVGSPSNHLELLAGTDRVYKDGQRRGRRSVLVNHQPRVWHVRPISALAIAPNNDAYIYAGVDSSTLQVTTNGTAGSPSWYGGHVLGTPLGIVSGIAVDPTNPAMAYASFSGFALCSNCGQHLFKTTNAGHTWADISSSLPNIPFESVVVNPNNSSLIIAGSDAGIFDSPDGGTTWYRLGTGLPNVAIDQIFTNHTGTRLFVATHGRGMWELSFPHSRRRRPASLRRLCLASVPTAADAHAHQQRLRPLYWTLTSGQPASLANADRRLWRV